MPYEELQHNSCSIFVLLFKNNHFLNFHLHKFLLLNSGDLTGLCTHFSQGIIIVQLVKGKNQSLGLTISGIKSHGMPKVL